MPILHNPDWNSLKLSDFPYFKCLCELCDCGCFERSRKVHTKYCFKKNKISNVFDSNSEIFQSSTSYGETFRGFKFESPESKYFNYNDNSHQLSNSIDENSIESLKIPLKHKAKTPKIQLGAKGEKISSETTNKESFRSWQPMPVLQKSELPDAANKLLYPNAKRGFITTNKELLFESYGNHRSKPSGLDLFENTFSINQGNKMNLDTVYRKDFKKLNKKRPTVVTRLMAEYRNSKLMNKPPINSQTQSKSDYSYDFDSFKQVSELNKQYNPVDLFKSNLNQGLKPYDDNSNEQIKTFSEAENKTRNPYEETEKEKQNIIKLPIPNNIHLSPIKNIRFITTIDNQLIPKMNITPRNNLLPKLDSTTIKHYSSYDDLELNESSINSDWDDTDTGNLSTYRSDFKNHGADICMSKAAFKLIKKSSMNNKDKHQSLDSLKTNQATV